GASSDISERYLRRLDSVGGVFRGLKISCGRPQGGRQPAFRDQGLYHSVAEIVPRPLRHDPPTYQPSSRAHPARQVAEPEAESRPVQFRCNRPTQKRLQLTEAVILPARKTEIIGRVERGCYRSRGVNGQPFVHQQLTQRGSAAGLPVVVIASEIRHQPTHLALTR